MLERERRERRERRDSYIIVLSLSSRLSQIRFTRLEVTMYTRDVRVDEAGLRDDEWVFVHPARRDRSLLTTLSADELAMTASLPVSTVKILGR